MSEGLDDELIVLLRLLNQVQLPSQGSWVKELNLMRQKHLDKYSNWLEQNLS